MRRRHPASAIQIDEMELVGVFAYPNNFKLLLGTPEIACMSFLVSAQRMFFVHPDEKGDWDSGGQIDIIMKLHMEITFQMKEILVAVQAIMMAGD